jgi:hypothetical protein
LELYQPFHLVSLMRVWDLSSGLFMNPDLKPCTSRKKLLTSVKIKARRLIDLAGFYF